MEQRRTPQICYLDTSAFDHLLKRERISEREAQDILAAVGDRRIVVVSSLAALEEAVGTFARSAELAARQLRLIHDVTERFVKPAAVLLEGAVRSYATDGSESTPFVEAEPFIRAHIREWTQAPGQSAPAELLAIATETRSQKKAFQKAMRASRKKTMPAVAALHASGSKLPFARYVRLISHGYAEELARRVGLLDSVMARGVAGLLKNRIVRVAVGYMASYSYAQTVEKGDPRRGDSRDQEHAICASVADSLVTDDVEFGRLFSRAGETEAITLKALAVRLGRR